MENKKTKNNTLKKQSKEKVSKMLKRFKQGHKRIISCGLPSGACLMRLRCFLQRITYILQLFSYL